jgi:propanol-preferring alcohol dehydrogenase
MPKAAVCVDFTKPLEIQDVPIPEPGPGQVLIEMEASGICHTDLHATRGDWPMKSPLPFIAGHEGVGIVRAVGEGTIRKVGERVAIPWLGYSCGTCRNCINGWETICPNQIQNGFARNGAFAKYAAVDGNWCGVVPDGVSSQDAAPLVCAGVTTYKAVKVSGLRSTELAAVFGIGGLGHLALQYARIAGGVPVAVDVKDDKLELARELGADYVVNASREDPVKAIQALGGADVAIVVTPNEKVFDQALAALRPGGRLVCVALPAGGGTLSVPIFDTVLFAKTVIGSIVGTRNDLDDVLKLHALGKTKVISISVPIEDINQSFNLMLAGKIPARHVIMDF